MKQWVLAAAAALFGMSAAAARTVRWAASGDPDFRRTSVN